ncbi:MAG: hypothetical protein ABUK11_04465 [Mariprofundaceae bacterium]
MIARRLAESVLFLEARCRTDADREYTEAIRRVIEEHALLRETVEKISFERNFRNISKIASSALRQTAGSTINEDAALRETLAKLAGLLPSDEQLKEILIAKSLIRKALK